MDIFDIKKYFFLKNRGNLLYFQKCSGSMFEKILLAKHIGNIFDNL